LREIRAEGEINNDNQPAPKKLPLVVENIVLFGEWGHSGICHRKMQGVTKSRATIKFPKSFETSLVDLFGLLFPKQYVIDVILVGDFNKHLRLASLLYGEFRQWVGNWLLMATITGPEIHKFWKLSKIDVHNGAPFGLNHLMSRNRFHDILKHLTLTNKDPQAFKDRFHYIQQLVFAWNENIQSSFQSGWATCLDESMSTWTNHYMCPGFMCIPRNPCPFINEYHLISCGSSGVMFGVEIAEGKDSL
jgi:hypothetical protein